MTRLLHSTMLRNLFSGLQWCALLLLVIVSSSSSAFAQAAWEFTPYEVRIWLALPDDPTWNDAQIAQLRTVLLGRAETTFGPVWNTKVDRAPDVLATQMRGDLNGLKVEQVQNAIPGEAGIDKIYLIAVNDDHGRLQLQIRELDYRARLFGVVLDRETMQRDALAWTIWDGIVTAFTPIARIERVNGNELAARTRAGGLITTEDSPAWIRKNVALRPVLRRNDRNGEPAAGGISILPWTMLNVLEQSGPQLSCKLQTGYRSPIPAKGTARLERLALLVKPQFPSTVLHLRSRDASASPLAGYEIWRKTGDTDAERIGATDWRGDIELPQAETAALQTLLVKSGNQLLARLPLVPGQQPQLEAAVVNDDGRLQAEGFIASLQSKIMDLEARRQISAVRIRAKIKDDKLDDAQKMFEEFRNLETRSDLSRMLDKQIIKSVDPTTQKRIDKMLVDARTLLSKFLDPELGNAMQRELLAAKKPATPAKGVTPPKAATPTPAPAPMPTTPATPMPTTPMPTTPPKA
ncbi:hypothetical protein [Anatilimnocola floriformis]|uniref:hypothetical protein n=1 Tax=Anatilimnocola floriformis TaxID=2948575 RepID=UPI0020C329A6|nr:hypothetical protein [Anatilimnocola floriformis]